jgi:hypothetical protein
MLSVLADDVRYRKEEPADPDWVLEMIARYEIDELTYREIGPMYGISHMTAYNTIKRWTEWAKDKDARKRRLLRAAKKRVA